MNSDSEEEDNDSMSSSDDSPSGEKVARTTYGPLYTPVPIVSITVKGGQVFHLHKDILTQNSAYFERALNGPFIEGQTQSIDLDDIEPEHFGLYVSLVYPTTVVMGTMRLGDIWTPENMTKWSWTDLLRLWQLSDRFLNHTIKKIARTALNERFDELSVGRWRSRYKNRPWPYIKDYVSKLNCAYLLSRDESLPLTNYFIAGFANVPPQVFAVCMPLLDDFLRTAATEQFAFRLADRKEMNEKRARDGRREKRRAAKKQKRNE